MRATATPLSRFFETSSTSIVATRSMLVQFSSA